MRRPLVFLASLLFAAASARASTLTVSESGVFSATTPTTAYSAPNGAFTYSFLIATTPSVTGVSLTNYFSPAISGFTYTLNGVTTSPVVGSITVYNLFNDAGLFDICFVTACDGGDLTGDGFQLTGPQIYSGSEANPTILTGSYVPSLAFFVNNGIDITLSRSGAITIAATPEPSSIALLGSGLLAASAFARRRRSGCPRRYQKGHPPLR